MKKIYCFFLLMLYCVISGRTYGQCTLAVTLNFEDTTLCQGSSLIIKGTTLNSSGSNYYTWFKNGVVISGPSATYSPYIKPSVTASDVGVYTLKVEDMADPGTCFSEASTTINVTASTVAGTTSTAQTICSGQTPTALTGTASTGGTSPRYYKWQSSNTGATGPWTQVAAFSSAIGFVPGALTANTYYRRIDSSGACAGVPGNVITITVNSVITAGVIGSNQSICANTTPTTITELTAASGGNGTFAYEWEKSTDGGTTWSAIVPATTNIFAPGSIAVTTQFRRKDISGVCPAATSNVVTITVLPGLNPGVVAASQTICYNTTPAGFTSITAASGGTGTYAYQWESSVDNTTWSNAAGTSTNSTYSPGPLVATTYYRRSVTSGTGACSQATTTTITITVNPDLTAGSVGSAQTICYNTAPAAFTVLTASTGGTGTYTYQWQSGAVSGGPFTNIASATNSTYTSTALTTTTYFTRTVTSGTCGSKTTAEFKVTVNPPVTAGAIGSAQSICANTTPAALIEFTSATGGNGTYTYQWQSSLAAGGPFTSVTGSGTNANYTPGSLSATTYYRRSVVSGGCPSVASNAVTITILPGLIPGTISANQTICYNATPVGLTSTAGASGGTGTYAYQWESSLDNTTWTNVAGATTNSTYSPGALTTTTYYRRSVISGTGTCSQATTPTVTITVNPDLTAGSIGSDQTICLLSNPSPITEITTPTGGTGIYNYFWESSITGIAGSWSTISGATINIYNPAALSQTTYFRRTVTSSVCGSAVSTPVVVTVVLGDLDPGSIGTSQTICYNATPVGLLSTAGASGGTGVYTYQWEQSTNNSIWSNATGTSTNSTYSPGALTTTTYYRRIATSGIGTCSQATTATVTINVNPDLTAGTVGSAQTVCNGGTPTAFTQLTSAIGGTGTYTYQWKASTATGGPYTNIASATNATYTPSPLTTTTYYVRTVTSGTCGSMTTPEFKVTVNPPVTSGTIGSGQSICANTTPAALTETTAATGGNGIYTYIWESSAAAAGPFTAATPSGTNATYTPGSVSSTTYFRRTVNSPGCTAASSAAVTVTVLPGLSPGSIAADQTICYNTVPASFTSTTSAIGGTGTYAYQWESSTSSATALYSIISSATNASYTPGSLTVTTYFRRTVISGTGTCNTAITPAVTVAVVPITPITLFKSGINCPDNGSNFVTLYTGETVKYDWYKDNVPVKTFAPYLITKEPGEYYAVRNYGCDDTYAVSNKLVVTPCSDYGIISGKVFEDLNKNGAMDAGEKGMNAVKVLLDNSKITFTDSLGNYEFYVETGSTYNVAVNLPSTSYTSLSSLNYSIPVLTSGSNYDNKNFGLYQNTNIDLRISLYTSGAVPGKEASIYIYYFNEGTSSFSGKIKFNYPKGFVYVGAPDANIIHDEQQHTLEFTLTNVPFKNYYYYNYWIAKFTVPTTFTLGQSLTASAEGIVNGIDTHPNNNLYSLFYYVRSAFDPNDKSVFPTGVGNEGLIEKKTDLDYTIRFQNTGTYKAFTVIVRDTIDEHLDITSLEMLAASHPYVISAKGRVISWAFYNINLPDKTTDEPNSHGFIKYRLKQKSDIALGDEIRNKAAIYFDFNEPVITNETLNTIGEPTISAVKLKSSDKSIVVYPNPATSEIRFAGIENTFDYEITDLAGNEIMKGSNDGRLNISAIEKGIYIIKITTENGVYVDKIVKD